MVIVWLFLILLVACLSSANIHRCASAVFGYTVTNHTIGSSSLVMSSRDDPSYRRYQAPFVPLSRQNNLGVKPAPLPRLRSSGSSRGTNGTSTGTGSGVGTGDASVSSSALPSNASSRLPSAGTPNARASPLPLSSVKSSGHQRKGSANGSHKTTTTSHGASGGNGHAISSSVALSSGAMNNGGMGNSNKSNRRLGSSSSMPSLIPTSSHGSRANIVSPVRSPRSIAILTAASDAHAAMATAADISKSPYHGRHKLGLIRAAVPTQQQQLQQHHKRWNSTQVMPPSRTNNSSAAATATGSSQLPLISGSTKTSPLGSPVDAATNGNGNGNGNGSSTRELRTVTVESTRYELMSVGSNNDNDNGQPLRAGVMMGHYVSIALPIDPLLQQVSSIQLQCWSRHDGSSSPRTASLSWAELHVDTGGADERSAYADLQTRVFSNAAGSSEWQQHNITLPTTHKLVRALRGGDMIHLIACSGVSTKNHVRWPCHMHSATLTMTYTTYSTEAEAPPVAMRRNAHVRTASKSMLLSPPPPSSILKNDSDHEHKDESGHSGTSSGAHSPLPPSLPSPPLIVPTTTAISPSPKSPSPPPVVALATDSSLVIKRAGTQASSDFQPPPLVPLPDSYIHSNKAMPPVITDQMASSLVIPKQRKHSVTFATQPFDHGTNGTNGTNGNGNGASNATDNGDDDSVDVDGIYSSYPRTPSLPHVAPPVDITRAEHPTGWKRAKIPHRVTLLARSRADWIAPPITDATHSAMTNNDGAGSVSASSPLSLFHLRLPMPHDHRFMVVDRIWCTCISACRPVRTDAIIDSNVRSWVELVVTTDAPPSPNTAHTSSSSAAAQESDHPINESSLSLSARGTLASAANTHRRRDSTTSNGSNASSEFIAASSAPVVATAFVNRVPATVPSATEIEWQSHTIVFDATHPATILSALRPGRTLCVRSRCDGVGWSTAIRSVEIAVTYTRWQWADEPVVTTLPITVTSRPLNNPHMVAHDAKSSSTIREPDPLLAGEERRDVRVDNYDGGIGDEVGGSDMPHVAITVPSWPRLVRLESLTVECVSHDQGWGDTDGVTSSRAELVLYSSADSPTGVSPVVGSVHRRIPLFNNPAARHDWTHHSCTLDARDHHWLAALQPGHTIALHIRCSNGWGIAVQRSHMKMNLVYGKEGHIATSSPRPPSDTTINTTDPVIPDKITSTVVHRGDVESSNLHPVVAAAVAASSSPPAALRRLTSIGPILIVPVGPTTPVHLSPAPTKRQLATEVAAAAAAVATDPLAPLPPSSTTPQPLREPPKHEPEPEPEIVAPARPFANARSLDTPPDSPVAVKKTVVPTPTAVEPVPSGPTRLVGAFEWTVVNNDNGMITTCVADDGEVEGVEEQTQRHASLTVPANMTAISELIVSVTSRVGTSGLPVISPNKQQGGGEQSQSWLEIWLAPPIGDSNMSCSQRAPLYYNDYPSYDWATKHILMTPATTATSSTSSSSPKSSPATTHIGTITSTNSTSMESFASLLTHLHAGWTITIVSRSNGIGWTTAVLHTSLTLKYQSSIPLAVQSPVPAPVPIVPPVVPSQPPVASSAPQQVPSAATSQPPAAEPVEPPAPVPSVTAEPVAAAADTN